MDALHSFQTFVCRQNLISSTAYSVRTVHHRKVGLTAFDTKRWLREGTMHTHSHGHKDTVEDPMVLVNKSYITCSVVAAVKRLTNLFNMSLTIYFRWILRRLSLWSTQL